MYFIYTATAGSNYNKRNRHVVGQKERKVVYTSTTIAWQATSKRIKRRWLTTQYDPTNVKLMSPHYPTDDKLSSWQRPTGSLVDAKWQVIFHLFLTANNPYQRMGDEAFPIEQERWRKRRLLTAQAWMAWKSGLKGGSFLLGVWTWLC